MRVCLRAPVSLSSCIRAFVKQLRAMLGDPAARPAFIFNERGVGYCMAGPGEV